ncbi:hypothetical protein KK449_01750 [Clostridioides difficile]|nr:hypothetical protein [Clostridioides difficile]
MAKNVSEKQDFNRCKEFYRNALHLFFYDEIILKYLVPILKKSRFENGMKFV